MKVSSWLKSHTFQSALHMQSVDHSNIDSLPFPVTCVRKFGPLLVKKLCIGVCVYGVLCTIRHVTQCRRFLVLHTWFCFLPPNGN